MFFGDHYLNAWWSLWEARWYTGFDIISYPPMVHQLIALLGHMIGVDAAYALLLWGVIIAYPLAVYAFSQIFTSRAAASYAALGASILPSIYLSAHTFGQLPSLAGTLLALFGISALADFLRGGNKLSGAVAVSLFTTVAATHHATLLFLPWLCLAVLFRLTFEHGLSRIQLFRRLLLFTILTLPAMLMVIWPFWDWGVRQVIQTPIDHASRHNFFKDPIAAVLFFFPMYGLFIPCVPFAFWIGLRKRYWGLGLTSLFPILAWAW